MPPCRETLRPAASRPFGSSRLEGCPSESRLSRRCPEAGRRAALLRACDSLGFRARVPIVGIRRRAFDPHVAAVEVLVFPHRDDLLDALYDISARRERVRAMRRRRYDRDACFADLEPADTMMQRDPHSGPSLAHFFVDAC